MKRLVLLLAVLVLVLPVAAQDMGSCMLEAPETSATINMIGWTYPIIDFYADELSACNAVDNIDVNTQLLDSGAAHDQLRLALGTGGTSPYGHHHGDRGRCRVLRSRRLDDAAQRLGRKIPGSLQYL